MRLVLIARRGSPVVHYAGLYNNSASSFCGSLNLVALERHDGRTVPTDPTSPWWWGSPTDAADARILDHRRVCAQCLNVFDQWAAEINGSRPSEGAEA